MTDKFSLGDRMKEYELTTQSNLLRRTPVIIRIDGRAFHTFTKRHIPTIDPSLKLTPFSEMLHNVMVATSGRLLVELQNAKLVYTQSDEISILLRDWDTLASQQWFGGNIQKIVSVSSSIATATFNFCYERAVHVPEWFNELATFDSRVYNLPKEEVANYFIWRQQDASRNSIQMLGHYHFSQKQMHGKSNNEVQDMLMLQKNINWNDLPTWMKRGTCVFHNPCRVDSSKQFIIDNEIPIFTQDRKYVEQYLIPPIESEEEMLNQDSGKLSKEST